MDYRTAAALCATDLAPLIEAGDFRQFGEAERLIGELVASLPTRQRGPALALLAMQLSRIDGSAGPESDALLRAVKADVRRHQQRHFDKRRLTAQASGA